MLKTDNQIRILSWNVRSFHTEQKTLREEIRRLKPHITVLQETGMWIENEPDLQWAGAKILNLEAQQRRRGGLAIIMAPEVEFTEIRRDFNGEVDSRHQRDNLDEQYVEKVLIFSSDHAIRNEEVEGQLLTQLDRLT